MLLNYLKSSENRIFRSRFEPDYPGTRVEEARFSKGPKRVAGRDSLELTGLLGADISFQAGLIRVAGYSGGNLPRIIRPLFSSNG